MSHGCHRKQRAETFRKSNFVSHIPRGRITKDEASLYIRKFESYFETMDEKRPYKDSSGGSKGYIRLLESSRELDVEISGNTRDGAIKIRSGFSSYSEIHFSPRGIHIYRSEHDGGIFGQEAAVFLSRRLPSASLGFGSKTHITNLLQSI